MATTADPQPTGIEGQQSEPTKARGWGTPAPDEPLGPMEFERRPDVRYRFLVDMTRGL